METDRKANAANAMAFGMHRSEKYNLLIQSYPCFTEWLYELEFFGVAKESLSWFDDLKNGDTHPGASPLILSSCIFP